MDVVLDIGQQPNAGCRAIPADGSTLGRYKYGDKVSSALGMGRWRHGLLSQLEVLGHRLDVVTTRLSALRSRMGARAFGFSTWLWHGIGSEQRYGPGRRRSKH